MFLCSDVDDDDDVEMMRPTSHIRVLYTINRIQDPPWFMKLLHITHTLYCVFLALGMVCLCWLTCHRDISFRTSIQTFVIYISDCFIKILHSFTFARFKIFLSILLVHIVWDVNFDVDGTRLSTEEENFIFKFLLVVIIFGKLHVMGYDSNLIIIFFGW